LRRATKSPLHRELLQKRIAELKSQIPVGGEREAIVRSLLYAGMGRGSVDERGFETVRRIRRTHGEVPLPAFKTMVRDQFNMLLIDHDAALAAIPSMLPADAASRRTALDLIKQVLSSSGELSAEVTQRLDEITRLFIVAKEAKEPAAAPPLAVVESVPTQPHAIAS
jgi:hypothetical protein